MFFKGYFLISISAASIIYIIPYFSSIGFTGIKFDGGIDTEFVRGLRPDFDDLKARDGVLSPEAIAANYVMLHKQPKSAWTHELDLRPWGEKW